MCLRTFTLLWWCTLLKHVSMWVHMIWVHFAYYLSVGEPASQNDSRMRRWITVTYFLKIKQ